MLRTVFAVVRLLLWAVIAASLAWLAFVRGGSQEPVDATATPTVDLTAPQVEVSRGTVENTVVLTGTVVADPAVAVRSTASGVVRRLHVQAGAVVAAGAPLVDVTTTVEAAPITNPDGTVTVPAPRTRTSTVTATVPGTVRVLDVLVDQGVTVGDQVATVSPGTLTVEAPLTQAQQFRLLAPPSAAEVTVPGGPAPFTCTDVRTGIPDADGANPAGPAPQDPFAPPEQASTGAAVTCRVPAGVPAFAGLTAEVSLQAGVATDVLVLPVTAVRGSVASGLVYVLGGPDGPEDPGATEGSGAPGGPDAAGTETPVVLGLTDGQNVEIKEGVAEGTSVLEFVPGLQDATGGFGPGFESGFGVGG